MHVTHCPCHRSFETRGVSSTLKGSRRVSQRDLPYVRHPDPSCAKVHNSQKMPHLHWLHVLVIWLGRHAIAATATSKASNSLTSSSTSALQIYENEIFVQGTWRAGTHRWTYASNGQPCLAPNQLEPPWPTSTSSTTSSSRNQVTCEFMEDWKIVKTSLDKFGWDYQLAKPYPIRRRLWWRSYRVHRDVQPSTSSSGITSLLLIPKSWVEDFNFKGYGLSLYKSIMSRNSAGMTLRLPLTSNFDAFDRMPALPSISSGICVFYPTLTYVLLSISMRVEPIQHLVGTLMEGIRCLVLATIWTLLRGVVLAFSALVYPVTRKLYHLEELPESWRWQIEPIPYRRTVEERVGASFSWRYSPEKGYHFCVTYWHYYAPTVSSMLQTIRVSSRRIPSWVARYAAALGVSSGGFTEDAPYLFCSALLSLSGIYPQKPAWFDRWLGSRRGDDAAMKEATANEDKRDDGQSIPSPRLQHLTYKKERMNS